MSMSMSASKALSVSRIFSSTDFVDEVGSALTICCRCCSAMFVSVPCRCVRVM